MGKIQDLSSWAEAEFAGLCSEMGATRNKSTQDRTGWDYLVEFASDPVPNLPADMQPLGSTARVQVKSKQSGTPAVRLKLSNALRYAKGVDPCFVVLFLATQGGTPVRIYARHVWGDLLADILRRARMTEAAGDAQMHRIFVSILFSAEDEHTDDLLPWMKGQLDEVGPSYAEQKAQVVRSVGMEDGGFHGTITFTEGSWSQMVDHELGLLPNAPVSHIAIMQRRFGIDAAHPLLSLAPDFVTITSEPRPCHVRVRAMDGTEVWLDGGLRVPGIPDLPPEFLKWRVVADFLDLVSAPGGPSDFKIRFDAEEQRSLSGMQRLVQVMRMALAGPLDIHVRVGGESVFWGELNTSGDGPRAWLSRMEPALAMLGKVGGMDAPADLTLSFRELDAAWEDIHRLNGLVMGQSMTATLEMDREFPEPFSPGILLAYDYADVGGWCFMAVVSRRVTSATVNGPSITLVCGDPYVLESAVRRGEGATHRAALQTLYRLHASRGDAISIFDGDFRVMARHLKNREPADAG